MVALAVLCLIASPVSAQRAAARPPHVQGKVAGRQEPGIHQGEGALQKHAGDWLRRYKNLPPDEQRRELEKDPDFAKLPRQRQAQLLERLQRFSNLPSVQQDRILSRMETWEHLTRDQKQQARELFRQIQKLQ